MHAGSTRLITWMRTETASSTDAYSNQAENKIKKKSALLSILPLGYKKMFWTVFLP